jgi:hypothetical protein
MSNNLTRLLRRAPAVIVNVKFDQVTELIGEKKARELAIFHNEATEIRKGRVNRRSTIPASKRVSINGIAGFYKADLLKAIEKVKGAGFQAEENEPKANPLPNQELLSPEKKQELKARKLIS